MELSPADSNTLFLLNVLLIERKADDYVIYYGEPRRYLGNRYKQSELGTAIHTAVYHGFFQEPKQLGTRQLIRAIGILKGAVPLTSDTYARNIRKSFNQWRREAEKELAKRCSPFI